MRSCPRATPSPPRRPGQAALVGGPVHVRMGLHTGEPTLTDEGYVGGDVHRAARICAAGHGGQVVVSDATRALLRGRGAARPGRAPAEGPVRAAAALPARRRRRSHHCARSTRPISPCRRRRSSAVSASSPRWSASSARAGCSRSRAPAERGRRGSPRRRPPRSPSTSREASGGSRSPRFVTPRS